MKTNLKFSILPILMSLWLMACNGQALNKPDPKIVSTVTDSLTSAPTLTPAAIRSSFSSYKNKEIGLSLKYPGGWLIDEDPEAIDLPSGNSLEYTAITLASDSGLKRSDAASFESGQGFIVIIFMDGKGISLSPDMLPGVIKNIPLYGPPDKEDPKLVFLNGKQFAIAAYDVNKNVPYPNLVAVTSFGDKVINSFVYTSVANEDEFRSLFEEVLSSMEYSGE